MTQSPEAASNQAASNQAASNQAAAARDRVESVLFAVGLSAASMQASDVENPTELIAEFAAAEALQLTLADRLRAAVGTPVIVTLATQDHTAQRIRGVVEVASNDHVVVRVERGHALIPLHAVVSIGGLGVGGRPVSGVAASWTWRGAMRRWLGVEVIVYTAVPGTVRGELERVAADHVDIHAITGPTSLVWNSVVAVFNHHARDADADSAFEA